MIGRLGTADQKRDLFGIDLFQRLKRAIGIATNSTQQVAEFLLDDAGTDVLVGDAELIEELVIEEMPELANL